MNTPPRNEELNKLLEAYAGEIESAIEAGDCSVLALTANAIRNLAETRRKAGHRARPILLADD